MTIRILPGDCRAVLAGLPDESVHCVITSPPYWGLRSYLPDGHHDKALELGLEATPAEYIAKLVEIFREVGRVLRSDGTLWLNLGDCYATGAGKVGDHPGGGAQGERWKKMGPATQPNRMPLPGLKAKDMVGMPWRVALALQADGWWLRRDIIWHKPNAMPESVSDRPTSAHEYLFLLTKAERYYYDAEAISVATSLDTHARAARGRSSSHKYANGAPGDQTIVTGPPSAGKFPGATGVLSRRNSRSVWTIPTSAFSGAHFATFPPALVEPCILAGTSEAGCCPACGTPWARQVEKPDFSQQPKRSADRAEGKRLSVGEGFRSSAGQAWQDWRDAHPNVTTGWLAACKCPPADPVPCTVLDPFGGAGTVGLVADRLRRDAVLIELNPESVAMTRDRLAADAGLFAQVAE